MKKLPDEVQAFVSLHNLATIATISSENDYPYVLPIYFVTDDSFKIYFASHRDGRKLRNIISHPHIGMSITSPDNLKSLQLQGTATVAEQSPAIVEKIIEVANEKSEHSMPPIMKIERGAMLVVTFTIHWYRLANYTEQKAVFIEGKLEG